jgi:hypothetical protein
MVPRTPTSPGRLDQVDRVGGPEAHDAHGEDAEPPVEPASADGEQAADQPEKQQVGNRVAEVRGDSSVASAERVQDRLEDGGGADGAGSQAGGQTVDPQCLRQAANPRACEHHQPRENERGQRQVADIGGRGHRRRGIGPQHGGEVELARDPSAHAQSEQEPRPALVAAQRRAKEAERRAGAHHNEVQPLDRPDRKPTDAERVQLTGADPTAKQDQGDANRPGHGLLSAALVTKMSSELVASRLSALELQGHGRF